MMHMKSCQCHTFRMLRPGFVVPDSIVGRGVRGELGGLDEQGKLCPEGEAALYNGVLPGIS